MARVLVVDDDPAGLEIRKLVLERRGHVVTTALHLEDALAAFEAARPDVVLSDLRVPRLEDGLSLIRAVQGARIIVLCGNPGDLDGRPEARMVDRILAKPMRSEELLKVLGE
jgi:two-component system response regulator GlrR